MLLEPSFFQPLLVISEQFKDIQEIMLSILICKTLLLPEGFTDDVYHVGNASEINSMIRSGVIPGGRSLKRGRQSVFLTITNPMENDSCVGETQCDLTKPRIAPDKILGNLFKIQYIGAI